MSVPSISDYIKGTNDENSVATPTSEKSINTKNDTRQRDGLLDARLPSLQKPQNGYPNSQESIGMANKGSNREELVFVGSYKVGDVTRYVYWNRELDILINVSAVSREQAFEKASKMLNQVMPKTTKKKAMKRHR